MTITLDDLGGTTATRRPGDFRRRGTDGPPYVSDPNGGVVKSGQRKGEPKLVLYGRPSAFGEQIENTYNLLKWKERRLVLGMALDGERKWDDLATLEVDTPEWRAAADGVVARAYTHAKAMEAAHRGTHTHGTTEDNDKDRDWVKRAEDGEDLGIPRDVQASMVAAWQTMLDATGMEVLAVELPVVCDRWRLAGTLDRIVRLTRDLSFVDCDGVVANIPAETVIVLDLKTGKLRRDRDGNVERWHSYAVQIAAYAQSVPYDVENERRLTWGEIPLPDPNWAIIAHLPVEEALAGKAVCRLIAVDIATGEQAADLCRQAKEWEARRDVFAVAPDLEFFAPSADATQPTEDERPYPGGVYCRECDLDRHICKGCGGHFAHDGKCEDPACVANDLFADLPTVADKPFEPKPERRTLPTRIRAVAVQDDDALNSGEGANATAEAVDAVKARLERLREASPAAFATLLDIARQATAESPTVYGISTKVPSQRRINIMRGLLALAEHFADELADEHLRCIGVVIADAQQLGVPIHRALLALTPAEARAFHQACMDVVTGDLALTFADDAAPRWVVATDLVANPAA
jgi:hypothetical protein